MMTFLFYFTEKISNYQGSSELPCIQKLKLIFFFLSNVTFRFLTKIQKAAEFLFSLWQEVAVCSLLTVGRLYLYIGTTLVMPCFFCTVLCTWKCRFSFT